VHQCRWHGSWSVQNLAGVSSDVMSIYSILLFFLFYSVKGREFLTSWATVNFLRYAEQLSELYWGIRKKSQGSAPSSSLAILSPVFPFQLADRFAHKSVGSSNLRYQQPLWTMAYVGQGQYKSSQRKFMAGVRSGNSAEWIWWYHLLFCMRAAVGCREQTGTKSRVISFCVYLWYSHLANLHLPLHFIICWYM
jgi:hypothetical protein